MGAGPVFGVTTAEGMAVPAQLVATGAGVVLVLRQGLVPDTLIAYLDDLLGAGLGDLLREVDVLSVLSSIGLD